MLASDFSGIFLILGYYALGATVPIGLAYALSVAAVRRASPGLAGLATLCLVGNFAAPAPVLW